MTSLVVRTLSAFAIGLGTCYAQAETLTVMQDSFASGKTPARNYGAQPALTVNAWASASGFIQFDVSALGGQVITSAILSIEVTGGVGGNGGVVELRPVETPWSEGSLTFDNQPAFGAPLATLPIYGGDVGGTVSVGITSIVQGWVDGSIPNYGLALTSSETDRINVLLGGNTASIDVRLANALETSSAQVELTWLPPSTRSDGSALAPGEIGGYALQVNGALFSDDISGQAVALTVGNLLPGDYCFELATRDIEGRMGPFSEAQCWSVRPFPAQS
jgi:hypothetical protein